MLELEAIRVAYGQATALWDVSLSVGKGELLCIVGPNSAGKSTLINAVAGLHRISAGRMRFEGQDISRLAPHRFCAQGIALVPEGRRLFTEMTVRENLELGSYLRAARLERARSLEHVCALFPALEEKLSQPAGSLSGGQQQMVAIGRALMARPKLLLLDEPSLGLAPSIVLDMFTAIRRIHAEGIAVLLVEQNVGMALDVAERAAVLEEGRIVALGRPEALMARPELRRAYLGLEEEAEGAGATPGATAHGAASGGAGAAPSTKAARH
jgi:branched-chain amino acid transport system ATP-binding protein